MGSKGNIYVSGWVTITGNKTITDSKANNVYLTDSRTIDIIANGLEGSAKIGVTTQSLPTDGNFITLATGAKKGYYYENIIGDQSNNLYTVREVGDSIVLTRGQQHRHAICGNESESDCVGDHDDAMWQPLTYDKSGNLKYGVYTAQKVNATGPWYPNSNQQDSINVHTLPAGNYYLTGDVTIDGTIEISGDVNLCLNGHTLSTGKVSYAVLYTGNHTLRICDCRTNGCLQALGNGVTSVIRTDADVSNSNVSGTLYIYGGKLTGGNISVYMKGEFHMYGGSITGNGVGVEVTEGGITIGGNANITSNTVQNVNLTDGKIITIDKSLTQDARIGITTHPAPAEDTNINIATGANNDNLDYFKIFTPDATNMNYAISKNENGNLYLGVHQHSWTYTAEGAAIKIRCDANGCNLGADFYATYTVTAPEELTYSGSEKAATITVSGDTTGLTLPEEPGITYQKKNGNVYENLGGVPTDAGTYQASITMDGKTASVTYTINRKEVASPTIEVADAGTYDGAEKIPAVTVKDGNNVIPEGEYSVSYENNINAGINTATVTIKDAAGGNYNVSGSTTFTIGKAMITVTPTAGQKKIYGMSDPELEYSSSGAMAGETPDFTGALSRATGKDAGKYDIILGTLALDDNSADNFKAANYELKLADTPVQFMIVPKTLTADDLEFTADSILKKTYDKTTACTTARVQIRSGAIVDENDELPTVAGTYVYNSENVKDANKVIFTSEAASAQNYILPAGLKVEHEAEIEKAGQKPLIITPATVPYGTDYDLTKIVSGGSGTGEVTFSVTNGSGVATITGSILHPVKVGEVTVVAVRAADDNYYQTTSNKKTVTISRVDYTGTASKIVNIVKNRSTAQTGTLTAADFFPEGQIPEGVAISAVNGTADAAVMTELKFDQNNGSVFYSTAENISSIGDQTYTVTISSTNYNDITATLIFRPTDKMTVEISGLNYVDKIYDGKAIEPTGTLQVSDDMVPVNELEVRYAGTGNTNYDSTEAPKDAGTYKVTYKVADDNGYYTGQKEYTFTISPKTVTTDMIGTIDAQEYNGSEIKPEPGVKDGEELTHGRDFEFGYQNNIDAGENTATLTITGKGNYTGTASREFTITPKDIKGAVIELEQDSFAYTGLAHVVKIKSVTLGVTTLTSEDYEIAGGNEFISANDAILLTIKGKGNYTGEATTTWKITRIDLAPENFEVTPDLTGALTYDGSPKTVDVRGKDGFIGIGKVTVYYEGISGTTYARSDKAPMNAGEYKVTVSVAAGTNYNAIEFEAGMLTIHKAAALKLEDIREFYEFTLTGEQTINVANVVAGATGYVLGTVAGDTGVISGLSVDQNGIVKFALNGTGVVGNTVKLPLTITSVNYEDSTVNVVIVLSPEYRIIDGADSSWTQNTDGVVVIRGNGEISKFRNVRVDGKIVDAVNYTVTEGSTIITLKADYLKTLSEGSHSFEIIWEDGKAATHFTVASNNSGNNNGGNSSNDDDDDDSTNNTNPTAVTSTTPAQEMDKVPATGDPSSIWLTLFVISLTGFAGMLVRRKKADRK